MKQIIMDVLDDMSNSQVNLASEAARETVSSLISAALKTNGFYKEYTDYELDEQKARAAWVCSICGENTFEVDYDYLGSGYNHLGCELKSQEEIDEYIEDIDEQAYAQGRGSSMDEMEIRRQKNWLQKKHEDKVFGHDQGGSYSMPAGEEVDGMYFDDEVKGWEEAVGYVEPDNDTDVELRDKVFEEQKHEFYENTQKQLYNEMTSDGLPEGGDAQAVKESHRLAEELVDSPLGYIYESPDGGETIYQRKVGESKKTKLTKTEWKEIKNEKK